MLCPLVTARELWARPWASSWSVWEGVGGRGGRWSAAMGCARALRGVVSLLERQRELGERERNERVVGQIGEGQGEKDGRLRAQVVQLW